MQQCSRIGASMCTCSSTLRHSALSGHYGCSSCLISLQHCSRPQHRLTHNSSTCRTLPSTCSVLHAVTAFFGPPCDTTVHPREARLLTSNQSWSDHAAVHGAGQDVHAHYAAQLEAVPLGAPRGSSSQAPPQLPCGRPLPRCAHGERYLQPLQQRIQGLAGNFQGRLQEDCIANALGSLVGAPPACCRVLHMSACVHLCLCVLAVLCNAVDTVPLLMHALLLH
jgi:hypothetical protein